MKLLKILAEAALETIAETDINSQSPDPWEQVDNFDNSVRINEDGHIITEYENEPPVENNGQWVQVD